MKDKAAWTSATRVCLVLIASAGRLAFSREVKRGVYVFKASNDQKEEDGLVNLPWFYEPFHLEVLLKQRVFLDFISAS